MCAVNEPAQTRSDVEALLRRIWAAIVRYRRTVVAMVGFALLQVVFTKLPFLVIEPLLSVLAESDGVKPPPAVDPTAQISFFHSCSAAPSPWRMHPST